MAQSILELTPRRRVLELLARLWCEAESNNPDDTISDAGHTVLDGLLGGLDQKALARVEHAAYEVIQSVCEPCAGIALGHIYAAPPEAVDDVHVQAEASSYTARTIARKIWQLARGSDPEEQALRASERISAAQELYDEMLSDTSPDDPEYGERVFDAMKAAIAKADSMRDCGV